MCPFESGGQEAAVKGIPVEVEKNCWVLGWGSEMRQRIDLDARS